MFSFSCYWKYFLLSFCDTVGVMYKQHFPDSLEEENNHSIFICTHFPFIFLWRTLMSYAMDYPTITVTINTCTLGDLIYKRYIVNNFLISPFPTFLTVKIRMLNNNATPAKKPGLTLCASVIPHHWSEEIRCIHLIVLFIQLQAQTQVGLCNTSKTRLRNSVHSM